MKTIVKALTLYGHIKNAEQRTIIQQYCDRLVRWPLMGGLLHLVQRGGAWAGCGPAQSPPCSLSDHIRSQFGAVSFSNVADFFYCAEVDIVCRVCHLILSIYV